MIQQKYHKVDSSEGIIQDKPEWYIVDIRNVCQAIEDMYEDFSPEQTKGFEVINLLPDESDEEESDEEEEQRGGGENKD